MHGYVAVLVVAGYACLATAQPATEHRHSVQVWVTSEDSAARSEIQSYVSRELRALGNVELLAERSTGPRARRAFVVSTTVVPIKVSDQHVGYAIGVEFLRIVDCAGNGASETAPALLSSNVYVIGARSETLQDLSRQIVADFDTTVLMRSDE